MAAKSGPSPPIPLMNTRPAPLSLLRKILLASLVPGAALLLSSCDIFLPKPHHALVQPKVVVPADFLYSPDEAFNEWMDTGVRVSYHKVPFYQVFNNPPFTELAYEVYERPEVVPLLTFDSIGITRRQFLWAVSHDLNVKLTLKTLPNGKPVAVIARSRDLPNDTNTGRYD